MPEAHPDKPATIRDDHPVIAAIALGANLGDSAQTIEAALVAIAELPRVELLARSSLHITAPIGGPADQPDYCNAAALLETTLDARSLLDALLGIERAFGRDRSSGVRWGPRALDLDLLTHADSRIDQPGLCVPHPRMTQRRFVLAPLAEIAPDLVVPGFNREVAVLLEALP